MAIVEYKLQKCTTLVGTMRIDCKGNNSKKNGRFCMQMLMSAKLGGSRDEILVSFQTYQLHEYSCEIRTLYFLSLW